jgi:hypothetical protein
MSDDLPTYADFRWELSDLDYERGLLRDAVIAKMSDAELVSRVWGTLKEEQIRAFLEGTPDEVCDGVLKLVLKTLLKNQNKE